MTTCSHTHEDDIPAFLCRRCHPELNKTEWKPPTKPSQDFGTPDAPRDRYGRQLARGIEQSTLDALYAEQDKEIAAKKASDQVRFEAMRAEKAEQKAALIEANGGKPLPRRPRRVKRK